MLIRIRREGLAPATYGTMEVDGERFGYTLELPWKDNQPRISCIPPGLYEIRITHSNRFGRKMILVMNVIGREGIRIHNANIPNELHGCIAVARKRHSSTRISQGISQALQDLVNFALSEGETVTLEILDPVKP